MSSSGGRTFDAWYEELSNRLRSTGNIKNISDDFSRFKTDQSRAAFTLNLQYVNDIIKVQDGGGMKSNIDALKFKDLGNKQFQKGIYDEAIKLYTKSIVYAPLVNTVNTLAIGYANRSAALFHKGLYQIALLDIERAMASNYPEQMFHKLYERKGKCLRQLGHTKLAAEYFDKALAHLLSANISKKKLDVLHKEFKSQLEECLADSMNKDIQELKFSENSINNTNTVQHHPEFPEEVHEVFSSLSDACDVAYNEEQGRFIIAKRDLKPGETVLTEKPFASVVLFEHSLSHCHECFKRVDAPVPSTHCCLAVFCTDSCREAAETYHKYEWPSLESIAKSGVGKFGYLALRTIAKCGPEFLRKFKKEVREGHYEAESKKFHGSGRNRKYEANEYNAIYNLVTHVNDRSVRDLFRRSVMAVFLLKCLEKGCFFDRLNEEVDAKDFREFVTGLLLSHLQAFPCNAHEISELEYKKNDIAASVSVEIGAGIYSTLSLFNHSCDPAANRNFYGDTCVVRTIKPVKKGQEISDNYGAVYAVHSLEERQDRLVPQYYFKCACQACVENWPLYPEINYQKYVWKCENCQNPLPAVGTETAIVCCIVCDMENNIVKKTVTLENSTKNYQKAFNDLLEGNVEKALPAFLVHLDILDSLVCRPWKDFNNCQEAIKQCFSIMANHVEV